MSFFYHILTYARLKRIQSRTRRWLVLGGVMGGVSADDLALSFGAGDDAWL